MDVDTLIDTSLAWHEGEHWADDELMCLLRDCDMASEGPAAMGVDAFLGACLTHAQTPAATLSPQHSGSSGGGAIYLPNAVCKGPQTSRSSTPVPVPGGAACSLPALAGAAWRTVTTQPGASDSNAAPPSKPHQTTSGPLGLALDILARLPSSGSQPTPASSSGAVAPCPPPAKQARTTASARPRRAPAAAKQAPAQQQQQQQSDDDTDSEDSNDTEERLAGDQPKSNKRKAPDVDWRSIEDPAERRRQRRLAKNRVTAARSRERKKSQWAEMEEKLSALEADNRQLREMLETMSKDNQQLREQLAAALGSAAPGATAGRGAQGGKGGSVHTEPAVLVLIATLLLVWAFLPSPTAGDPSQPVGLAGLLGAAALLLTELRKSTSRSSSNSSSVHEASSEASALEGSGATPWLKKEPCEPASDSQLLTKGSVSSPLGPYSASFPLGATTIQPLWSLVLCVVVYVTGQLKQLLAAAKGLPPLIVARVRRRVKAARSSPGRRVHWAARPTVCLV